MIFRADTWGTANSALVTDVDARVDTRGDADLGTRLGRRLGTPVETRLDSHRDSRIEAYLLTMVNELRLLLKRDDLFLHPDQLSTRVYSALRALEREVAAIVVVPDRAVNAYSGLCEVRTSVDRLFASFAPPGRLPASSRALHDARAAALLAVQGLRDALMHYFDDLFRQSGSRAPEGAGATR